MGARETRNRRLRVGIVLGILASQNKIMAGYGAPGEARTPDLMIRSQESIKNQQLTKDYAELLTLAITC